MWESHFTHGAKMQRQSGRTGRAVHLLFSVCWLCAERTAHACAAAPPLRRRRAVDIPAEYQHSIDPLCLRSYRMEACLAALLVSVVAGRCGEGWMGMMWGGGFVCSAIFSLVDSYRISRGCLMYMLSYTVCHPVPPRGIFEM